jgi:ADP-ribosylglycohydrolase
LEVTLILEPKQTPSEATAFAPAHSEQIHDKVLGCWLGKSIGGTLGAPDEGQQRVLNVIDYPPLEAGALPNDDLDLQLLWLSVLERHGLATDAHVLSRAWLDHVRFPYGEYGYAIRNLRRGLLPPLTGSFDNPFTDGMGSPIRTEIWAIAAMGKPHLAAALAFEDAIVDHAGEGVVGSIFFSTLEAAAFQIADPDALLDLALEAIPSTSKVAQAVRGVRSDHQAGEDWLTARANVLARFGNLEDFTDAPQNISFAIIGWLYGSDFSDAILKTVNCGFDTDSSGAMIGALLGILHGASQIPARWTQPLGERVVVSPEVGGFEFPRTLEALTRRSIDVARMLEVQLHSDTPLARAMIERASTVGIQALFAAAKTTVTWRATHARASGSGLEVAVAYPNGPAVAPGGLLPLRVSLHNRSDWAWEGQVGLSAPNGWQVSGDGSLQLAANSSTVLKIGLSAPVETSAVSILASLVLEQTINGIVWQRSSHPVAVVLKTAWTVTSDDQAPRTYWLEGGALAFLDLSDHGEVIARVTVRMPETRPVRVVAMGKSVISVHMNGAHLFSTDGRAHHFASPHITRHEGYERSYTDITLAAGDHHFELHYPAVLNDGSRNQPDFRIASMLEPRYQHFTDVPGA